MKLREALDASPAEIAQQDITEYTVWIEKDWEMIPVRYDAWKQKGRTLPQVKEGFATPEEAAAFIAHLDGYREDAWHPFDRYPFDSEGELL